MLLHFRYAIDFLRELLLFYCVGYLLTLLAGVKSAFELLKDMKEKTCVIDGVIKNVLPIDQLIRCCEIACKLLQKPIGLATLRFFFAEESPKNQYYARALFMQGRYASVEAESLRGSVKVAQVSKAIQFIMSGLDIAKSDPKYNFLVYNASVHYWHVAKQMHRSGARKSLVASVSAVTAALEAVGEPDVDWRIRLTMLQAQSLYDNSEADAASKCCTALLDFAKKSSSSLYRDVYLLSIALNAKNVAAATKVKQDGGTTPALKVAGSLQLIRSGVISDTAAVRKELTDAVTLLKGGIAGDGGGAKKGTAAAAAPSASESNDDNVVAMSELCLLAADHGVVDLAQENLAEGLKSGNLLARIRAEMTQGLISIQTLVPDEEKYTNRMVSTRSAVLKSLERTLQSALRTNDNAIVQDVCILILRVALPLLQPNLREHIKRPLFSALDALENLKSPLTEIRAVLLLEGALCDVNDDFLSKALERVDAALEMDYTADATQAEKFGLDHPLDRYLIPLQKRLSLRTSIYEEPDNLLDQALLQTEQVRDSKDVRLVHSVLSSAFEKIVSYGSVTPAENALEGTRWAEVVLDIASMAWKHRLGDLAVKGAMMLCETEASWDSQQHSDALRLVALAHIIQGEVQVAQIRARGVECSQVIDDEENQLDWNLWNGVDDPIAWIQEQSEAAVVTFNRALDVGLKLQDVAVCSNAAIYIFNVHLAVIRAGRPDALVPIFEPLLKKLLTISGIEPVLLCTIATNLALGCERAFYIRALSVEGEESLPKDLAPHLPPAPLLADVVALRRAFIKCPERVSASDESLLIGEASLNSLLPLNMPLIPMGSVLRLLARLQLLKGTANPVAPANAPANAPACFACERLLRIPPQSSAALKDAYQAAREALTRLEENQKGRFPELWARLAQICVEKQLMPEVLQAARQATFPVREGLAGSSSARLAPWYALAEISEAQALLALIDEERMDEAVVLQRRVVVAKKLASALTFAGEGQSPRMGGVGVKVAMEAVGPMLALPASYDLIGPQIREILKRCESLQCGVTGSMSEAMAVARLEVFVADHQSSPAESLRVIARAFAAVAPGANAILWEAKVRFLSACGRDPKGELQRGLRDSTDRAKCKAWLAIARSAQQPADQIAAYLSSFDSIAESVTLKSDVLLEMAGFLLDCGFPVGDVEEHARAAKDAVLEHVASSAEGASGNGTDSESVVSRSTVNSKSSRRSSRSRTSSRGSRQSGLDGGSSGANKLGLKEVLRVMHASCFLGKLSAEYDVDVSTAEFMDAADAAIWMFTLAHESLTATGVIAPTEKLPASFCDWPQYDVQPLIEHILGLLAQSEQENCLWLSLHCIEALMLSKLSAITFPICKLAVGIAKKLSPCLTEAVSRLYCLLLESVGLKSEADGVRNSLVVYSPSASEMQGVIAAQEARKLRKQVQVATASRSILAPICLNRCWVTLAEVLLKDTMVNGCVSRAESLARQSLKDALTTGNDEVITRCHLVIAWCLARRGELEEAVTIVHQVLMPATEEIENATHAVYPDVLSEMVEVLSLVASRTSLSSLQDRCIAMGSEIASALSSAMVGSLRPLHSAGRAWFAVAKAQSAKGGYSHPGGLFDISVENMSDTLKTLEKSEECLEACQGVILLCQNRMLAAKFHLHVAYCGRTENDRLDGAFEASKVLVQAQDVLRSALSQSTLSEAPPFYSSPLDRLYALLSSDLALSEVVQAALTRRKLVKDRTIHRPLPFPVIPDRDSEAMSRFMDPRSDIPDRKDEKLTDASLAMVHVSSAISAAPDHSLCYAQAKFASAVVALELAKIEVDEFWKSSKDTKDDVVPEKENEEEYEESVTKAVVDKSAIVAPCETSLQLCLNHGHFRMAEHIAIYLADVLGMADALGAAKYLALAQSCRTTRSFLNVLTTSVEANHGVVLLLREFQNCCESLAQATSEEFGGDVVVQWKEALEKRFPFYHLLFSPGAECLEPEAYSAVLQPEVVVVNFYARSADTSSEIVATDEEEVHVPGVFIYSSILSGDVETVPAFVHRKRVDANQLEMLERGFASFRHAHDTEMLRGAVSDRPAGILWDSFTQKLSTFIDCLFPELDPRLFVDKRVILVGDKSILELPLESCPLFQFSKSISRDFSLETMRVRKTVFANSAAAAPVAEKGKKAPAATGASSSSIVSSKNLSYAVDLMNDEGQASEEIFVGAFSAAKTDWKGFMSPENVPSVSSLYSLLNERKCGLLYLSYGPIGDTLPASSLVGQNFIGTAFVGIWDKLHADKGRRRYLSIRAVDNTTAALAREMEKPYFAAMLWTIAGVQSITVTNWIPSQEEVVANLKVFAAILGTSQIVVEELWKQSAPPPPASEDSPEDNTEAESQPEATSEVEAIPKEQEFLFLAGRAATQCYGLPDVAFSA